MSETNSKDAGMPDRDGEQPGYDFATAFWSAKHALAHASAIAFARHGVHEGQQFVLASPPSSARPSSQRSGGSGATWPWADPSGAAGLVPERIPAP